MNNTFKKALINSVTLKSKIIEETDFNHLTDLGNKIVNAITKGGKLLICGNGGSAADAQHLAAELLIRLKPMNNRQGIPAISLAMDSSTLTACGNDFGYDVLFSRMVETLGQKEDILLVITTSGNSENINSALRTAKKLNIFSIGFLGSGGGAAKELCDDCFVVPSSDTARIQEAHITVGHALMEYIEDSLLQNKYLTLAGVK